MEQFPSFDYMIRRGNFFFVDMQVPLNGITNYRLPVMHLIIYHMLSSLFSYKLVFNFVINRTFNFVKFSYILIHLLQFWETLISLGPFYTKQSLFLACKISRYFFNSRLRTTLLICLYYVVYSLHLLGIMLLICIHACFRNT